MDEEEEEDDEDPEKDDLFGFTNICHVFITRFSFHLWSTTYESKAPRAALTRFTVPRKLDEKDVKSTPRDWVLDDEDDEDDEEDDEDEDEDEEEQEEDDDDDERRTDGRTDGRTMTTSAPRAGRARAVAQDAAERDNLGRRSPGGRGQGRGVQQPDRRVVLVVLVRVLVLALALVLLQVLALVLVLVRALAQALILVLALALVLALVVH